jgi:cell division protein FtsW
MSAESRKFSRTDNSVLSRWWWTVDRWTVVALFLLAAIGIVLTMAASPAVAEKKNLDPFYFAHRQALFLPVSLLVLLATSLLAPKGVRRLAWGMFAVAFVATVSTLFIGTEVNGARRWLRFGGLSIQPSEFLKPAFAVVCAVLFTSSRLKAKPAGYAVGTGLLIASAAVLAMQPDFGTTVLVAGAWAVQVFVVGCPLPLVGLLAAVFVGGGAAAYLWLDHVRKRIDYFLNPQGAEGYQIEKALDSFRSGGMFGLGPGEGRVKAHLPDAHADFIFAVAGEEFGLVLCLTVVGLFAFVVLQALSRALKDKDLFVVLATSSLIALFGAQALMNMASALHLMPPKGITLPFISYGGSATIALAWGMGMVLALTRKRPDPGEPV